MKVYILFSRFRSDSIGFIRGVYGTLEAAAKAREKLEAVLRLGYDSRTVVDIREEEVQS